RARVGASGAGASPDGTPFARYQASVASSRARRSPTTKLAIFVCPLSICRTAPSVTPTRRARSEQLKPRSSRRRRRRAPNVSTTRGSRPSVAAHVEAREQPRAQHRPVLARKPFDRALDVRQGRGDVGGGAGRRAGIHGRSRFGPLHRTPVRMSAVMLSQRAVGAAWLGRRSRAGGDPRLESHDFG